MATENSIALIADTSAFKPLLTSYAFVSVSGSNVSLTGYYTDYSGNQIGSMVTITIGTTATGFTSIPKSPNGEPAAGFVGTLSAAIWVGLNNGQANAETPKTGYPQIAAGNLVYFGRAQF